MTGQHVRVTLEGTATREPDGQILRLRLAGDGPLTLVSMAWPGVDVEYIEPAREWRRGDVVVNTVHHWTLTRGARKWVLSVDGSSKWTDQEVDESLTDPSDPYHEQFVVLRYQAGESE